MMVAVLWAGVEAWEVLRLEQGLGDFCSGGRCAQAKGEAAGHMQAVTILDWGC